ncbi:MAG: 40S ribosomal protein S19 [Candidatus Pacearchaeota archaeon]
MHSVQKLDAQTFNAKLAEALKKDDNFVQPEWLVFVKSGHGKQRPIEHVDFWYARAASILRQIHLRGSVGVQRLRTRYGNRKDRGKQPAHFARGSGKIIRMILQQSEKAGILTKATGKGKGRMLTEDGKKLLESIN